jgi:hypothetical protein
MLAAIREPLTPGYEMRTRARDGRRMADIAATFIAPNDRLTSGQRLAIYNRQYWYRLLDSLADDFPGLVRILGQHRFDALSRAYLDACPSRSYTLRNLGSRLPEFLAEHPTWAGRRQALALDMARLEWAKVLAFDNAALPPLTIDELLGRDPAQTKLALQPHLTLLELRYPIDDFLIALKNHQAGARGIEAGTRHAGSTGPRTPRRLRAPRPRPTFLAVHRVDFDLYYKRLDPALYVILTALQAGRSLQNACARGAAAWRHAAPPPPTSAPFADQLKSWFADLAQLGWFCRRAPRVA